MKKRTAHNSTLAPGKGFTAKRRPLSRRAPLAGDHTTLERWATKKKSTKKKRKATGEAIVFEQVARTRPHVCEVCSAPLQSFGPINFSHLLPKGSYPRYRLLPENIRIKCATCHRRWHEKGREALIGGDYGNEDGWRAMFNLHDALLVRYNTTQC